jgi:hypothetical protein
MDYQEFYHRLFAPLESAIGRIDQNTLFAIIGFDCGGPLNFCTIGADSGNRFVTYVSCELAVRSEQRPSEIGRYELAVSCDDEQWVRERLTEIGRMSMEESFGHGHTLDFGPCAKPSDLIQGVLFEELCTSVIDGENYGVLRCIGISRTEMEYAQLHGSDGLLALLQEAGVYPHTEVQRHSVV